MSPHGDVYVAFEECPVCPGKSHGYRPRQAVGVGPETDTLTPDVRKEFSLCIRRAIALLKRAGAISDGELNPRTIESLRLWSLELCRDQNLGALAQGDGDPGVGSDLEDGFTDGSGYPKEDSGRVHR